MQHLQSSTLATACSEGPLLSSPSSETGETDQEVSVEQQRLRDGHDITQIPVLRTFNSIFQALRAAVCSEASGG